MPETDINDRIAALVGFDLNKMVDRVRKLSVASDRARALAEHMEHTRKVVLAEAMLNARQQATARGEKITADAVEALGRTSLQYKNHLDALREAAEKRGETYAEYQAAKTALDLGQRQLSFAQTELKAEGRG